MRSRGCPGCDGGVPYPHETTEALIGRLAATRELNSTKESPVKPQKVDSAPNPTKKPATAFRMETGTRQQLLARVAGDIASGVVSAPTPPPESAAAIAEFSVDIAEAILAKIGL